MSEDPRPEVRPVGFRPPTRLIRDWDQLWWRDVVVGRPVSRRDLLLESPRLPLKFIFVVVWSTQSSVVVRLKGVPLPKLRKSQLKKEPRTHPKGPDGIVSRHRGGVSVKVKGSTVNGCQLVSDFYNLPFKVFVF